MVVLSVIAGAWLVADLAIIMGICRAASRNSPEPVTSDGMDAFEETIISEHQTYFEFERPEEEEVSLAHPPFCPQISPAHSLR